MYSAEDLFTEDDVNNDLIQVEDDKNSGNELEDNENDLGNEQEENEAREELNNDDQVKTVVKPKRTVRNPRRTLNVQILQGPKGLLCLEEHFKNKKYKGREHEQEDLKTVMKTYEYWCHRLFPKLPFDDCLAKIESLGTKKPMQTYLKRIRMGLIFDEEKPIQSDAEENRAVEDQVFDDQFDELASQSFTETPQDDDQQITEEQLETPQDDDQQITEEQLERIRLNKERADRLRREKLERRKEALAEASQGADCRDEVEETEEQLERIRVNKEKAERLCRERLRRDKPNTSDFVIEETCQSSKKTQEIVLESQSDNNELQSDRTRILDAAEEGNVVCEMDDIQNDEESDDGLPEHEDNDLIQQNTCKSLQAQINIDRESSKSISVQSDKDNEESMDCS